MENIRAFILAAGFGERLRPITNHIPKPLLPLLGKPIIEKILERVSSLQVSHTAINMHYKAEMIQQYIAGSSYADKVSLFREETVLGTGGALKNAASFLKESVSLVHNGDILSNINLERLIEEHCHKGNAVTLAVHDCDRYNNVLIDDAGYLKSVGTKQSADSDRGRTTAFMGIAVYSPEFLDVLPPGNSSVVAGWLKALSSGQRVGTVDFTGSLWSDIGTPDAYYRAVMDELRREGETVYIHPSITCQDITISNAVIERDCTVAGPAVIKNAMVLPDAKIISGDYIENQIAGPDFRIEIKKPHIMLNSREFKYSNSLIIKTYYGESAGKLAISEIGSGGSDRAYFRIRDKDRNAVFMACPGSDKDYERQMAYTKFFRKHAVPVPVLFLEDAEKRQALFEDLGDLTLYSWSKCRKRPDAVADMYRKVLDILITLHSNVSRSASECDLLQSHVFDYDHLRWETNYFLERFVFSITGSDLKSSNDLLKEFDSLAMKVDSFPKRIVHRDFQSQNIMITEGCVPRLVDYQGARVGPPAYDVASLLWDPYCRLEDDLRNDLLAYYVDSMKASEDNFSETDFMATILPCRLQRHMQALGAYGFLTTVKGKGYFLKHVPQALDYLCRETALAQEEYPILYNLVKSLHEKTSC